MYSLLSREIFIKILWEGESRVDFKDPSPGSTVSLVWPFYSIYHTFFLSLIIFLPN